MLREKIDELIAQEIHCDSGCIGILRLIKAEFQKYNASKEAVTKPMDDAIEIQILNRMVKQRKEAESLYVAGGRQDLAYKEHKEIDFIELYLPETASESDIEAEVNNIINSGVEPIKKNMGTIIKQVKAKYPTADGKLVSTIVSQKLN